MSKTILPLSVRRELWARIWQRLLQPLPSADTQNTDDHSPAERTERGAK